MVNRGAMKRSLRLSPFLALILSACGEKPTAPELVEKPKRELPAEVRTKFDRARLATLERQYEALEAARPILPKLGIDQVRLEKVDAETQLIASFTNGTGATVTAVQCRFFEHDASGGKPRTDDRVTFFFRDGLEHGQTVEMKASEVFPAKAPGLKPSLVPIYLIGKKRETIADGRMTEGEQAELEALRKKAGS